MPKLLKIIFGVIVGIAIIFYAVYQARNLIRGPILEITEPQNGETFSTPLIDISGQIKNISFIYLNDRQIFTTPEGNFSEKLLLSLGYNIMTLRATDKFGRETRKILELVLTESR